MKNPSIFKSSAGKTLALVLFALWLSAGICAQTPELTERNLMTPTGWYWLTGASVADVSEKTSQGFRVIDLEIEDESPLKLSVAMVRNTGEHQKTWWWYYGLTGAQLEERLSQNKGRIIDLEVYTVNNQRRYAVAMVRNTGSDSKSWWYYSSISGAEIEQKLSLHNARLIDLDCYTNGSEQRFSVVMIANAGTDTKGWWYYTKLTTSEISQKLSQNKARLTHIEYRGQEASGPVFSVIMEKLDGETWWWYYGKTMQEVNNIADQKGARIIDIEPYSVSGGGKRFAVLMLRNTNDLTERIRGCIGDEVTGGAYGLYLKRVKGPVLASLQSDRKFYPASTIKVLEHVHAMCAVQAGNANLNNTKITIYPDESESCKDNHAGHSAESVTLREALDKMMNPSNNQATNGLQEFFGNGNAGQGRSAINNTAHAVLGMSNNSAIRHKFGCGGPSNNPANSLTLEDLGKLYEKTATGLLKASIRQDFYSLMINSAGDFKDIADEEAAKLGISGTVLQTFKNQIRTAHKGGNWSGKKWNSIGGWVSLPVKNGSAREYVFGLFVDDAEEVKESFSIGKCRAELLRAEIRSALSTYK